MAQNNAINKQSENLTIDPAAATDSFIQFDESTTGKWRIGNDATDDSYRLSQGSALGTNDTFIMTSGGIRTMPLQPAFNASLGALQSNVTGDGTGYSIPYNSASNMNIQTMMNTSTGVATFPVTGVYMFSGIVTISGLTSSHTSMELVM